MVETLLLSTVRVRTFSGQFELTNASGFFFKRASRLFLVSSRHVFFDEPSNHMPDRITIDVHVDAADLAQYVTYSIPLYSGGASVWREAADLSGEVDVAAIEIGLDAFPPEAVYTAFSAENICNSLEEVEIGSAMLIVGYPLGFHDTLHHLPVARHAINASPLSFRFQGMGYFLTDARTHRGTSGACVVMRTGEPELELPWTLLGIHSARLDVGTRDLELDEALGLNCAWFADVLVPLTEDSG
jgi:hypothetical protein